MGTANAGRGIKQERRRNLMAMEKEHQQQQPQAGSNSGSGRDKGNRETARCQMAGSGICSVCKIQDPPSEKCLNPNCPQ